MYKGKCCSVIYSSLYPAPSHLVRGYPSCYCNFDEPKKMERQWMANFCNFTLMDSLDSDRKQDYFAVFRQELGSTFVDNSSVGALVVLQCLEWYCRPGFLFCPGKHWEYYFFHLPVYFNILAFSDKIATACFSFNIPLSLIWLNLLRLIKKLPGM